MDITDTKGALTSITVWGALASLAPALIEFMNQLADTGVLPPQVSMIVSAVGGLLAIFGRLRAGQKISGVF